MRLVKRLATAGVASRRKAEEVIRSGRVAVNGRTVTDPARDVGSNDRLAVDGESLRQPKRRTVLLHKPKGVVSTAADTHGRPTVVDLVRSNLRLYPAGRLDADSEGLILLTNDGELADRLTHPRYQVPKTYRVTVRGRLSEDAARKLREGVRLSDGRAAPAELRIGRRGAQQSRFDLTIREGRNRQVRRMCEAVGFPVIRLVRIGLGPLRLGTLQPGKFRDLNGAALDRLRSAGGVAGRSRGSGPS